MAFLGAAAVIRHFCPHRRLGAAVTAAVPAGQPEHRNASLDVASLGIQGDRRWHLPVPARPVGAAV